MEILSLANAFSKTILTEKTRVPSRSRSSALSHDLSTPAFELTASAGVSPKAFKLPHWTGTSRLPMDKQLCDAASSKFAD